MSLFPLTRPKAKLCYTILFSFHHWENRVDFESTSVLGLDHMKTNAKLKKIENSVLYLQFSVTLELIFPVVILEASPHTKINYPNTQ